jgi:glycosyltransferase involved in cell wall biosynthesis
MKNIFILSSDGFPTVKNNNLGIFSFEQAKVIKSHKVFLFDLLTNSTNTILIDEYQGLKIYRLLNCKLNIFKIIKNFLFIKKISKKNKPDFILCSFLSFKNVIYSTFLKAKKIVLIHGSDANTKSFFRKIIFNFYLKKINKIICVSKFTKKILIKNYKNINHKTLVIHNGFSREKLDKIDTKFKKKIKSKKKILILTIANFVPRKNISALIDIFYQINLKMKNKFHLNIVGQGSEKDNLISLIKHYKLKKSVTIFSNLNNAQIASLYHSSKYFFLFSKNYKNEFEGFGIVFLEAMYKKNIIFASRNGGTTDILKDRINSFTFDIENYDHKKNILDRFFYIHKKTKIKRQIINSAYQYTKNFSWEKNINSIFDSL